MRKQVETVWPHERNRPILSRVYPIVWHEAAEQDRSFVVFRGTVYAQQPILWTVLNYLWSRFLRELGLIRQITPVIAVAANFSCDAERSVGRALSLMLRGG